VLSSAAFGLALTLGAQSALAQAWPTARPITLINPFPAGGGTDAFARPLAAQLDQQLNQRIIIDNRGGAGGTLGASQAAKATPDGYTFFVGAAHHTIAPAIYAKLEYDLVKDFVPIGLIAMPPQVISISPKALPNVKTLSDFIAYAKANPGKVNFGSAGNGTTHHLAGELFKIMAGVDLVHVPYRGAGPAMQDLVSGKIEAMFDGAGTSAPQIQGGNLVGLGVAAPQRILALANVPTAEELHCLDLVCALGDQGNPARHHRTDEGGGAESLVQRTDPLHLATERFTYAKPLRQRFRKIHRCRNRQMGQGCCGCESDDQLKHMPGFFTSGAGKKTLYTRRTRAAPGGFFVP
jgi:tripartite-type tricarboxylate transporter receptor subunit TctC